MVGGEARVIVMLPSEQEGTIGRVGYFFGGRGWSGSVA